MSLIDSQTGRRDYMEDRHIARFDLDSNQSSIFAVFDGHGGDAATQ